MRIGMVGAGYVGLVSAACFSEFGVEVVCVDSDREKIDRLSNGETTIYEPGLDALVARNAGAGRLAFTTRLEEATAGAATAMPISATSTGRRRTSPGRWARPMPSS